MACLSRPYYFKFFKGGVPQILLGPFLNSLCHLSIEMFNLPVALVQWQTYQVSIIWIWVLMVKMPSTRSCLWFKSLVIFVCEHVDYDEKPNLM